MDTVSNKSNQHGLGKITHHNQSTGKETKKVVPVWLHQALTSYLKRLPCGTCNQKGQKLALGMGISQSEANMVTKDSAEEEERTFLASEAAGGGGKLS